MNMYTHVLAHTHAHPYDCVRTWEGAGGRRMVCVWQDKHYKPRIHVNAHLVGPPGWVGRGRLGVCRWGIAVRTLSDLWGGVNGHSVNLRDQCGVCDDLTVRQGWMRRNSGSGGYGYERGCRGRVLDIFRHVCAASEVVMSHTHRL